ncbi:MAG: hypothetical protein GX455_13210 [Phycisphaerae bacterium]|nr:hypothetical protein [Phycisphaerae bacterium]
MSEDQRKGFELRGWHVIIGILAILVVLFILFRMFGHSALEKKIAELRAKGYPTTFEELEKYNQLPEATPNAADLYRKAINAYRSPNDEERKVLPYFRSASLKLGEPNAVELEGPIAAYLSRNAETLDLLRQAGQIEACKYNYTWDTVQGFILPNLSEIRDCARLLALFILQQAESNNTDQACRALFDHFQLAESLSRDPFLICHLVRIAIHAMGVESVRVLLERTTLSDRQMAELEQRMVTIRDGLGLDPALIGERCCLLQQSDIYQQFGFGTVPIRFSGLMDLNVIRSLEFYDRLGAVSKIEPERRIQEYQRISNDVDQLSVLYFMTKLLMPALDKIGLIELRVMAELDCARTGLAVERFRLAEGRLPESLEELVPKYIEAVPIDPFDGKPLRYKRLEKGYTIYSIGEDGEDNDGVPKDKVEKGAHHDWPFTVERE